MLDKRGLKKFGVGGWAWFILIAIIVLMIILDVSLGDKFNLFPTGNLKDNVYKAPKGFDEAQFGSVGTISGFSVLNYIFGKIPGHLIDLVENDISAAIIVVGIWIMFFLFFADIINLFGLFTTPGTRWVVAGVLTIIGANLKVITYISVYFLTITAVFGSFAILFSLLSIFVLFVLFHFGGSGMRRWILIRKAQDEAAKAMAGAEDAAAGVKVAQRMAEAARKIK